MAALLAMMLRCSIPDVRCFAYGPPACACAALSRATEGYIHSMVYCDDVIPRVSIQNVAALVEELSQCDEWQRTVGGDARALLHRYFVVRYLATHPPSAPLVAKSLRWPRCFMLSFAGAPSKVEGRQNLTHQLFDTSGFLGLRVRVRVRAKVRVRVAWVGLGLGLGLGLYNTSAF